MRAVRFAMSRPYLVLIYLSVLDHLVVAHSDDIRTMPNDSQMANMNAAAMPKLEVKDATYGTVSTPSTDRLPVGLMLPHQILGSSASGRSLFKRVVVIENRWVDGRDKPPSLRSSKSYYGINGVEVLPLNHSKAFDPHLFNRWLQDAHSEPKHARSKGHSSPHKSKASTGWLSKLWGWDKVEELDRSTYYVDKEKAEHMHYALAMLTFLDQCNTTYCVWMDSDMFVHRLPGELGWVDLAIEALEQKPQAVVVESPFDFFKFQRNSSQCHVAYDFKKWEAESVSGWSQKGFVVHRERLRPWLPVRVSCSPSCDTWEELFHLKNRAIMRGERCGMNAGWVMQPPDSFDTKKQKDQHKFFNKALRSCRTLLETLIGFTQDAHASWTANPKLVSAGLQNMLTEVSTLDLNRGFAPDSCADAVHRWAFKTMLKEKEFDSMSQQEREDQERRDEEEGPYAPRTSSKNHPKAITKGNTTKTQSQSAATKHSKNQTPSKAKKKKSSKETHPADEEKTQNLLV